MNNDFYYDSGLEENDFNGDSLQYINNDNKDKYNNHLESWIEFNNRVLNESLRPSNPIMERLNFIGIADSNMDEFIRTKFNDHKGLKKLIDISTAKIEDAYEKTIEELKEKYNIAILHPSELKEDSLMYIKLKKIFRAKLFPLIQPLLLTDQLPMPDMDDGGIFLVTKLENEQREVSGIIKLPDTELIKIDIKHPKYKEVYCVNNEIIEEFVSSFYRGTKIIWNKQFRVYRKIDSLYGESDNTNYLNSIKQQLNKRKTAKVMLVDVTSNIKGIKSVLGSTKKRIRKYPYGLSYLKNAKDIIKYTDEMIYNKVKPRNPIDFIDDSIFDTLSEKDVLVHFPYQDFKLSTVRLLEEAAVDPKVKSIRQTLYRVSKESRLIKALIKAANNGKQVVVLLELKAKMDEQHNIELTEKLRSAGCNLVFGPIEIKTHAKTTLIIREENGKLVKYCNISTGNFNEATAKIYEDFSYFCKESKKFKIGQDLLELFNYLGGFSELHTTNELLISPFGFRIGITEEIDKCIQAKKENPDIPVEIFIKCNSFTDVPMCDKLYEASSVGVKIKCIIRGMCIIKPGIKDLSDNIEVISIVGRYLEHSRIYQFTIGDNMNTYIGSGDLMPRNLDHRVEVLIPIKAKDIKNHINNILNKYYEDNTNSYKLIGSTYNNPIDISKNYNNESDQDISIPENIKEPFSIQNYFIDYYKKLEKSIIK